MSGDLGRLVLQFAADVAGFQSDLGRVERAAAKSAKETARSFDGAINGLTGSIKSAAIAMGAALAAAFTVVKIKEFIKTGIDLADVIDEIAGKVGVTTDALGGLKYAVEQNDSSFETLSKGLVTLEKNAAKAAGGNEKLGEIFTALGISVVDASGKVKAGDVLFSELADTLGQVQDVSLRNKVGLELLGKSFLGLVPTLSKGSEGIAQASERAKELGLIVDAQTGQIAGAFNDSVVEIGQAFKGVGLSIAKELLPVLLETSQAITEFIIEARKTGAVQEFAKDVATLTKALIDIVAAAISARDQIADFVLAVGDTQPIGRAIFFYGKLFDAIAKARGAEAGGGASKSSKEGSPVAPAIVTKGTPQAVDDASAAVQAFELRLRRLREAQAAAAKSSAQFVAAVRVLSIDKAVLKTPVALGQAIQKIREELDPTIAVYAKYKQAVIDLNKQSEIEINLKERNDRIIKQLTIQRDRDIAAIQREQSASGGVIASLLKENEALKSNEFDRAALAATQRIEVAYRAALAQAQEKNRDLTKEEAAEIRRLVEENDKLSNKKTFNFAGTLSDAINEGFAKGSLTAGFRNLIKQLKEAFSGGPEGVAGAIASIANGLNSIITAAQNSDGNSVGAGLQAATQLLADSGNVFAQAALAINSLFKGKLFGTDFALKSQTTSSTFGAGGFAGNVQTVDTRQRSFFRGTQTRTTNTAADAAAKEAGDAFQSALDDISRTISDAFGTVLSARVNASFVQEFDKNGALVSTIATVAGRTVAAGTQQAFEQFLTAQTIIDALKPSIAGLDALADPFRAAGLSLLEFAQFAFAAQTDIAQGAELLGPGSTFAAILPVIEDLARGGESLAETYARVKDGAALLNDALKAIGENTKLAGVDFVKFSAQLVVALGGLNKATEIIGRNIAEFFSPDELRATRLTNARTTLTGLGESTGLGALSDSEFKDLLKQALAGAFDAERTAEIFAYGDALATFNGLVRETASAAQEAAQAQQDNINALNNFVTSLQDQAADGSLTDYQRTMKALNKQYEENAQSLNQLAKEAGLSQAPIEGVTANLSILAQGAARALGNLKISVLKGLDELFGSEAIDPAPFGYLTDFINGGAVASRNWAEQIEQLEKLQSSQDLARNIADLFKTSGLSFADGVEQYGVPLQDLLKNLGVDLTDLTDPASLAAFGAAAGLLGISAEELAKLTGVDLSGLTEEQKTALDIASAPQVAASESSASSLLSIDEKSTSVITLLMQQNTTAREQNENLGQLTSKFNALADEVRRLANRVPSA